MPVVELRLPSHRYEVRIEAGALDSLGPWVRAVAPHARAALVADVNVPGPIAAAERSLRAAGYDPVVHRLSLGEAEKTLDTVAKIYGVLIAHRLERKSPVIALGGGVAGDAVGFAAASYLRGVPFIQCPTTLLAMVDASVGGKTGVNLPQGKNLVGAFHQPHLVVADPATLATLPPRDFRCGLAECVKHAAIRDPELFAWTESRAQAILALDMSALTELVTRNVAIKAAVVMEDEKETGVRAHLNFGHTFAHAIEAEHGYGKYLHGEAVALGMVAAARLGDAVGRTPPGVAERIARLLAIVGLPTTAPDLPDTERLIQAMSLDKKVADGQIRLILLDALGQASIVRDTPVAAIRAAWESLRT